MKPRKRSFWKSRQQLAGNVTERQAKKAKGDTRRSHKQTQVWLEQTQEAGDMRDNQTGAAAKIELLNWVFLVAGRNPDSSIGYWRRKKKKKEKGNKSRKVKKRVKKKKKKEKARDFAFVRNDQPSCFHGVKHP